jgi:serine/threonine protein kinase
MVLFKLACGVASGVIRGVLGVTLWFARSVQELAALHVAWLRPHPITALDYRTATVSEIVQHCSRRNPDRIVISELEGGHSIIRISKDVIIKCGFSVTQQEADNQDKAYYLVDQKIIRVPRVLRYVRSPDTGYLIMEFIDGEPLHTFDDPDICATMIQVLAHFAQIRRDRPGPLSRGAAQGILWSAGGSISPSSITEIETYFNTTQLRKHAKIQLDGLPFSLCHLDLAPRNVLKLNDGSLCLIDWATAGFYPKLFEVCTLQINCPTSKILEACHLDPNETAQARLLEHAYYLGEKHTL